MEKLIASEVKTKCGYTSMTKRSPSRLMSSTRSKVNTSAAAMIRLFLKMDSIWITVGYNQIKSNDLVFLYAKGYNLIAYASLSGS